MFDDDRDANWSLAPLQLEGDEFKAETKTLVERLGSIATAFGVQTLFAPNPTQFNGIIAKQDDLPQVLKLPGNTHLHRGFFADGIELLPGNGMVLSAGGCPLITAWHGDIVVVAHAGLESLFNLKNPERLSVVDNIVAYFKASGVGNTSTISARVDFAIPPHQYAHPLNDPEWSEKNQQLCSELTKRWGKDVLWDQYPSRGCIDLVQVIKSQFATHECTQVDQGMHLPPTITLSGGKQIVAYHTRMPKPYCNRRNLIVAMRVS